MLDISDSEPVDCRLLRNEACEEDKSLSTALSDADKLLRAALADEVKLLTRDSGD